MIVLPLAVHQQIHSGVRAAQPFDLFWRARAQPRLQVRHTRRLPAFGRDCTTATLASHGLNWNRARVRRVMALARHSAVLALHCTIARQSRPTHRPRLRR